MAGAQCRWCGDASAPGVQTPCCQQWRGCDTACVSLRGGGRCQVEHERLTLCSSHSIDGHAGPWQTCQQCREFWTPQAYKASAEHPINVPR
jgi:hypothetical protein